MAGHYINSNVTAGPTPAVHAGLNYVSGSFTLSETASGSTTIALCNIPAGARVVDAVVAWDNSDFSTTSGATVNIQSWTSGNSNGDIIQAADVSTNPRVYNPDYELVGYRHTASSQAVLVLGSFVGTGTAQTVLAFQLVYDCQLDGD